MDHPTITELERFGMPEPVVFEKCQICGNEIYEGEEYYAMIDDVVCEDCIFDYTREFKLVAERS